jgi:hypothetical protein
VYGVSKNGWMEKPLFFSWFESTFIPHIQSIGNKVPANSGQVVILLYDDHCSNMNLRIENNVVLILNFQVI